MKSKIGRPKGEQQNTRQALIDAARDNFSRYGYRKLSTRQIAEHAGVDAAMIRYYFGSKAALFEAMVKDTLSPILSLLRQHNETSADLTPLSLMQTYYRIISANPSLPRLIQQIFNYHDDSDAFSVLAGVFDEVLFRSNSWAEQLNKQQSMNPALNPQWIRLSLLSLMIFPLIAPSYIQKSLDIHISEDWLMQLAEHNDALLKQGLFGPTNTAGEKQ